ncbi:hypothetical protein PUN28_018616 [Cardiocondyla obscurior]|uniref:Ribosomal protein S7 n=1 Tax=Cardiocondyla obscurior TaxID=286306 RepID=A0AAW2EJ68_9HYME
MIAGWNRYRRRRALQRRCLYRNLRQPVRRRGPGSLFRHAGAVALMSRPRRFCEISYERRTTNIHITKFMLRVCLLPTFVFSRVRQLVEVISFSPRSAAVRICSTAREMRQWKKEIFANSRKRRRTNEQSNGRKSKRGEKRSQSKPSEKFNLKNTSQRSRPDIAVRKIRRNLYRASYRIKKNFNKSLVRSVILRNSKYRFVETFLMNRATLGANRFTTGLPPRVFRSKVNKISARVENKKERERERHNAHGFWFYSANAQRNSPASFQY